MNAMRFMATVESNHLNFFGINGTPMKFGNIIKVSKTKTEQTNYGFPSKYQWILDFYCTLRSMIPAENNIYLL